jgi:hypothetical protein
MKSFIKWWFADFRIEARQYVRLFLSPFIGAVRGFLAEARRIDEEDAVRFARWREEAKRAD